MSTAKKPAKQGKRTRIDWEAIERDYRTGKFTLKELEAKHSAGYADISRRAKKDGWTKDLQRIVRQATSAALIADTAKAIANTQQTTTNVVLALAELNKQVILGHRTRASVLAEDLLTVKAKLMTLADSVADIREAAALTGALEALVRSTKGLIDIERKAFGLDDADAAADEPIGKIERVIVHP
jgi:hypothetical protein